MAADLYDAFSNEQRWVRPFLARPGGFSTGLARLADYGGRLGRGIAGGLAGETQTPPPPQPPPPSPRPQQPSMQAPPGRGPQAISQAQTSMTPASAPLPPVPREPPAASPMAQLAVAPPIAGTTSDTPAPLSANRASSPGYGGGAGAPMPRGIDDAGFAAAERDLLNRQYAAAQARPGGPQINDYAQLDQDRAAREALFRQYHQGMDRGDYRVYQNNIAGGDPYRQFLEQKIQQPGVSFEGPGGRTAVYRGSPYATVADRDIAVRSGAAGALNELNAQDPAKQLALFDQLASNPRRLGVYLATRGQDPNLARTIPQSTEAGGPGYNIGNLEQAATDPELAYLHQAMGPDSGLNLGQKLDLASKFIETGNPKYRDYTRAWLQRQQATNEAWQRDVQSIQPRTASQINLRGPLEFLGGLTGRDRTMELARNERARQILQMFPQLSASPAMAGTLGGY